MNIIHICEYHFISCECEYHFLKVFLFLQAAYKEAGKAPTEDEPVHHRIRITLTSRNVKSLETGWYFT